MRLIQTVTVLAGAAVAVLGSGKSFAVELLTDGGFEFATAIPGWDLEESIYDQTTMMPRNFGDIDSADQSTFGTQSGALDYFLRAFVGGQAAGPDTVSNAVLSQTVPGIVGGMYTFSGWSRFEVNYSGGFTTLKGTGPLGAVPSPTITTMELAFLDAGGNVLDSTLLDVKAARGVTPNNNLWLQHTINHTAPVGTVNVRVTTSAEKMLWNGPGNESAFFDNFTLTRSGDPNNTQFLMNPDFEDELPSFDPAYTIAEVPGGTLPADPTVATANFANRPGSGGQLGLWLRSFTGSVAQPADAIVSQTVAGVPGGEYTFSAWSNFQANYPGGAAGFPTQTFLEMAFLDPNDAVIGIPITLDVKADRLAQIGGNTNNSMWYEHVLGGTAPANTASVRVSGMGLDMVTNPAGGQQSAFLDDFSLTLCGPGDFNCDGFVDGDDFLAWQRGESPSPLSAIDLADWEANYGMSPLSAAVRAVPEPASLVTVIAATGIIGLCRYRRRLIS